MSGKVKFRAWDKREKVMFVDITPLKDPSTIPIYAVKRGNLIWMQYTGLKDKNGKEIYDKDIVGFEGDDCNGVVYQEEDGRWMIEWCDGDKTPLILAIKRRDFVVKGNIFETPELFRKEVAK